MIKHFWGHLWMTPVGVTPLKNGVRAREDDPVGQLKLFFSH